MTGTSSASATSLRLRMMNVGQGESIIIDFPGGKFAIIDAGPAHSADKIISEVRCRIADGKQFRFAALSHWDLDHIGGLPDLLSTFPPLEVVIPSINLDLIKEYAGAANDTIVALNEIIDSREIPICYLGARQSIDGLGDNISMYCLAPGTSARKRVRAALLSGKSLDGVRNDVSLVLWLRAFGRTLLLPGEVPKILAQEMLHHFTMCNGLQPLSDDPRADWIKLGHHGSMGSTDSELVRIFAKDIFVASASHGAKYGHPHPRVLQIVSAAGGINMCTRLGCGCKSIQKGMSSTDLSWTTAADWKSAEIPVSQRDCYGDIDVVIDNTGTCSVSGTGVQLRCPYGGPSNLPYDFPLPSEDTEAGITGG